MNSLQELNGYGSSTLDITDSRFAGIKYTPAPPASPFTQILNISSTTVTINAGVDITEIINYSTANVRYRVTIVPGDVDPLVSTVSWASLPSGVTLTTVGNVYTLSGINSVAQWQAVKSFTWNLPGNYASKPFWYLQVSIVYYDEQLGVDRTVDWEAYDQRFYFVAKLSATSSLSCDAKDVILASASIASAFTPTLAFVRVIRFRASLVAEASCSATGQINAENLFAVSSMPTAKLTYNPGNIKGNLTATSSVVCNGFIPIRNMFDRSYTANNKNVLFASDPPQIEDVDPLTTATFTVTFSSSIGKFSINPQTTAISPYSYSGTLAQVNNIFSQILFYPNSGVSSNGSFTYTQQKNAITQVTRTVNLLGNAASYVGSLYTFTSNALWTPTYEDITYGLADYLVVGGGGGGQEYGGGGGGGQVVSAVNQTSLNSLTTRTITIGSGGVAGFGSGTANSGGVSSISGIAAFAVGGVGGTFTNTPTYTPSGGTSGNGISGGSGVNSIETSNNYPLRSGGGGGGASGAGSNGTTVNFGGEGGAGFGSGISGSGSTYGIGGRGGWLRVAVMQSIGYSAVGFGGGGGGAGGFFSGAGTPTGQPLNSTPSNGNPGIVIVKFHA
jgi:hypothetical protein